MSTLVLPQPGHVILGIYNIGGQRMTTLVDAGREAGTRSVTWNGLADDGGPVASGVYLHRLTAGDFVETRKMMLLK